MTTCRHALALMSFAAAVASCSTAYDTINELLTETWLDTGYSIRNLTAPNNWR